MRRLTVSAAVLCAALSGPAWAATTSAPPAQKNAQSAAPAAQKMKQDLQNAGFTDVNVVAESFVVQAKTKDGNPVLMTIGPHGMSVFEALNVDNASGKPGSGANANAAAKPNSAQQ
jgi:hypothetical protein